MLTTSDSMRSRGASNTRAWSSIMARSVALPVQRLMISTATVSAEHAFRCEQHFADIENRCSGPSRRATPAPVGPRWAASRTRISRGACRRPVQAGTKPWRSEFGRQIAVDLKADANLDQRRSGPSHWSFSIEAINIDGCSCRCK